MAVMRTRGDATPSQVFFKNFAKISKKLIFKKVTFYYVIKFRNSFFHEHLPMTASEIFWLDVLGIASTMKVVYKVRR